MSQPSSPSPIPNLPRLVIQPQQRQAGAIILTPDQRHYLERVRRFKKGDPFLVLDGSGSLWRATWQGDQAEIGEELIAPHVATEISLHLGLAVIKGNGWDDLIRQLTELGVVQISPLLSQRTQLEPGSHKIERWRRIAREASEQCERTRIPQVADLCSAEFWWQHSQADFKGIAVARAEAPHLLQLLLTHQDPQPCSLAIAVGPEGGWTEAEVTMAEQYGWQMISLGSQILRAVTAPVVVASWVAGWRRDRA
ncbi:MAG: 16S rRNA (uracil(1498)-N(3))-methyltransferase [Cyanophyceae cyanobacterium]